MNDEKSISISTFISGFIVSIIGGLLSILLGFVLPEVYPNLSSGLSEFFIIIQGMTIGGGIITLIGTVVVAFYNKAGYLIILISGIVAGGNIITIIGAITINKKIKQGRPEQMRMVKKRKMESLIGNTLEDKKKWVEIQYRGGKSFREIAEELGEDMITVRHYLDDDLEKYKKGTESS
ncbi:MAG: hypothetical protein ACXACX_06525 [Candidatus Hodarchaeales archaeon]